MKKDKIFSTPTDPLVKFTFDKHVADVFPDMIERSVPGYTTTIAMIGVLAGQHVTSNSNCYDLGSSLGAATLAMRHHINQENVKIIAVDNSLAMIEKSQKIIDRDPSSTKVELVLDNILDIEIENASVCVLNFTLQFLKLEDRKKMIQKIYDGLLPGGILVLSEKIVFDKSDEQKSQVEWHHAFKKANGYSDLEVAQKRTALENVLIPETLDKNKERLYEAGFEKVNLWFQCFNFVSLVAEK
ncbi:MAG: carboxy-S-adenosyl-L-methionine synthase CmoA [Calditrichaeota bacterium]|nr:MAG: carboxy-S-adenosyl-L-methionine synthase CmoA [Calditrichota bacterium]MBL1207876.1 carboxy-S-adenosyl-L-methionine synthase CmoA [Calditrichota bacterium]NOG47711.1 carboxy-S-adenosyl-L-methionine synthase CmoA [Calditrichota bacterium]